MEGSAWRREIQSSAAGAETGERCGTKKRQGTPESLDFLIFHHAAVDYVFVAWNGMIVVVCWFGVQGGCLLV